VHMAQSEKNMLAFTSAPRCCVLCVFCVHVWVLCVFTEEAAQACSSPTRPAVTNHIFCVEQKY
jgi:hypothetical protein